jgi:uncharacterized phage protein gp47/JayE
MPWTTPSLRDVRAMTRDGIAAALASVIVPKERLLAALNAAATLGNSMLRVLSDATSGLAHLVLRYIDWLAKQIMPDTAETEWLDRFGTLWLSNADGTLGRKAAEFASGTVTVTGTQGIVVPAATVLSTTDISFETLEAVPVSVIGSDVSVRALDPGAIGNLALGDILQFETAIDGVDGQAIAKGDFLGGADTETDDDLRLRVLERIQQPPMGGSREDYVHWALEVSGVTRAWASPNEMGVGTILIRFMMDIIRADNNGVPWAEDVLRVAEWIDAKRPVAVKDCFTVAPIPFPINMHISGLATDNAATRAAIETALREMFLQESYPGATIYRSWVDSAITNAMGESHHELDFQTTIAPTPGHLPLLGSIIYAGA